MNQNIDENGYQRLVFICDEDTIGISKKTEWILCITSAGYLAKPVDGKDDVCNN